MKSNFHYRAFVLIVIISLCLSFFSGCSKSMYSPYVTDSKIKVENYSPSISNTRIISRSAPQMVYSNGKVYICYLSNPVWNNFAPWEELVARLFYGYRTYIKTLVCIEDGKIIPVCRAENLLGSYENYIYFCGLATDYKRPVCVYDTSTGTVKELTSPLVEREFYEYDFTAEGVLRIKVSSEDANAYHIRGDELLGCYPAELSSNTIQLGKNIYYLKNKRNIYLNEENITNQFPRGTYRSFHPIGDGVVVETEDALDGQFAWYINSNGEILSLIPEMECEIIHSSLAVYENYIFLSFCRMQYLEYFLDVPAKYDNDTLSGTYRIDIRDFSRTKISDQCFDSMFIFDDTGIFGNNGSGTYKIDFDGNPLLTIIEG